MTIKATDKQVSGSHYSRLPMQPAEFCQKNRLSYCESMAVKYIVRHQYKGGADDIRKAIHCLELLLELEYPAPKSDVPDPTNILPPSILKKD